MKFRISICHRAFCQRAFLAVLALLVFVTTAAAQKRPALSVSIVDFHGVSRVVVETANGAPATSDVDFNVVIKVRDYRSQIDIISKEGVLQRGSTSATVDVPYLQSRNSWTMYDVIVEQDGNRAFNPPTDLITTNIQPNNGWFRGDWMLFVSSNIVSNASRKFLVSGRGKRAYSTTAVGVTDAKVLPSFARSASVYQTQGLINQGAITNDLSVLQSQAIPIRCTHPAQFFEDWRSLHGFKTVLISLEDLKSLGKSNEKMLALRRWVSVGGNLVVFNVGDKFKRRNEALKLLQWDVASTNWLEPGKSTFPGNAANIQGNVAFMGQVAGSASMRSVKNLGGQKFIKVAVMQGNLFLIPDNMTTWNSSEWGGLQDTLAMSSDVRSTVGSFTSDRYYLQGFSIPGIGKPPVVIFQILIGLFVLVLGPLSYYLCSRPADPTCCLLPPRPLP